jgi:trehalose/maltose hydrolase-like predicted phosphorylase
MSWEQVTDRARFFSIILLTFLTVAWSAEKTPPLDWREKILRGEMLWASSEPEQNIMTSVGNGYVATVVGSDTVYVAGVYNGLHTRDPSHRARIPSTNAISIANATLVACAIDLAEAIYYRRLVWNGHSEILIEQRFYAHRLYSSVLVNELFVDNTVNSNPSPLILHLQVNSGSPSQDIDFKEVKVNDSSVRLQLGRTKVAEFPDSPLTDVAVMNTIVPPYVAIPPRQKMTIYFLTVVRTSLDSKDPAQNATRDYYNAYSMRQQLAALHISEWQKLWDARIELQGNLRLAQVVNSSLYYILSSAREDWPWSLSPGSLSSNGYNGHVFWDTETWMYPSLLLLHPVIAKNNLLQYRVNKAPGAALKAKSYNLGYQGLMFPWESAFTGQEVCPDWAPTGIYEQHITGDIAFAFKQYWDLTHDNEWLTSTAWPIIEGIATFWASRVQLDTTTRNQYVIMNVIPPDEYAFGNNSVFTNVVAKISLEFATKIGNLLGKKVPANWLQIANHIKIPFDETRQLHLEYDEYNVAGHQLIKQADVTLLGFPLMYPMPPHVRKNDLDYYSNVTDKNGPAMTYGMEVIGRLELGDLQTAYEVFPRSYANAKAPFGVWTETVTGGTTNFITGAGGFLQAILFGFGGIRIGDEFLSFNPILPPNTKSMKMRKIHYRGGQLEVEFDSSKTVVSQFNPSGPIMQLQLSNGDTRLLLPNKPIEIMCLFWM